MLLFCLAKIQTLSYTPIFCHDQMLIRSLKSPSTISATGDRHRRATETALQRNDATFRTL
jgi:hypothetical protein